MGALLNDTNSPPPQGMQHAIQRHREVLRDNTRDFERTKVLFRCITALCPKLMIFLTEKCQSSHGQSQSYHKCSQRH